MHRKNAILVTGGAGFIGSVTCQLLLEEKYDLIVVDNLSKGHKAAIAKEARFYKCSTTDKKALEKVFKENSDIIAVMHFAASIEVAESMKDPAKYFFNNVAGSLNVIDLALEHQIKTFIFSSTAAVYGLPCEIPITESCLTLPINPYGLSKLQVEQILKCYHEAYGLKYAALRYFNACGAYKGYGEDHNPETHLIPALIKVAGKQNKVFNIFGNKYDTKDGTAVRDFIHVEDLARAHIMALEALLNNKISNETFNLGSNTGYSVQEIASLAEKICNAEIPTVITSPRAGDPARLIASNDKIRKILGWQPKHDITDIIKSAWDWYMTNPEGYKN